MASRLSYGVAASPEVNASIRHIEDLHIILPEEVLTGFSLVDTFAIEGNSYYRVSSMNNIVHIDICTLDPTQHNTVICTVMREIEFESEVVLASLYPMLSFEDEQVQSIALLSCVLKENPNVLHFREILSGDSYPDLVVS